ncbi:5-phosphohydroxy-L-lysine phospho-lyase [Lingula anatina]|uniref:5-phosphohydroxy-L-lysine phospho-lyase n=1 Tax=Lingula anatina TaxID=7574 RepID=A0A1S3HBH2_LINAN|nr:5-phosphohydroxy-L-lysine phospho-lyase [Lingula anatina]|eukprot:XP_013382484.1 5-phosphohydroxy-L-lysine phospho-lyase [Lingula anatina]
MPEKFNYRQSLQMRRNYIGKPCKLHFEAAPLKIVCASKQYVYDDNGEEYLDCVNNISHVGHCHPQVVSAGQEQMAKLTTGSGFLNDVVAEYAKRLIETFPESLSVVYFLNSGSEANDLALCLARSYTKNEDVVVIDNAFHGNLSNMVSISPLRFKRQQLKQEDWVHVVPCPDTYRGMVRDPLHPDAGIIYANEVKRLMDQATARGRKIAAFFSECLLSQCGMILPPQSYFENVYRYIRDAGGLCVVDEIANGMGRIGEHMWSFQHWNVVPDIVTIGKPVGNGYPMSAVITRREIADSLKEFSSGFGGNPVSCSMGLAVLDVIKNEKLMSSAKSVGKCLLDGFRAIMPCHPMMGDVRGLGLSVGIEIVTDTDSRKPATEAADMLTYRLKQEKIIISNEGPDKNVMAITPPMCFTADNAQRLIQAFDHALADIEKGTLGRPIRPATEGKYTAAQMSIIVGDEEDVEQEPDSKRTKYFDLD